MNQPDAMVLRYQLAKQLEQAGKLSESCDQYLEILKKKPAWVADDLHSIRRLFDRAKRSVDLVQALQEINLKSLGHPYYVIQLVTEMLGGRGRKTSAENTELAIHLFERIFEAFPAYRGQMMSQFQNEKLWANDRIYQLGKRGVIPSTQQASAQPWFGLDNISSYGSGGKVSAMFHRLLGGVHGTDKEKDLRQAIEEGLRQAPGWLGGRAMLALIAMENDQKESAKKRFEELLLEDELLADMPSNACWIIGQELDQFKETRGLALRLFEHAVKQPDQRMNQFQYSPITRLMKIYAETGREEDARQLLLKQLRSGSGNQYDQQYANYQRVENTTWAATQMLEMGYPVDSIRLYRTLVEDAQMVEQAGKWQGRPDYYTAKVRIGLDRALESLDTSNAAEAMVQLLSPANSNGPTSKGLKSARPGSAILDLMLTTPEVKSLGETGMRSQLVELLKSISRDDQHLADAIENQFNTLRKQYPADLSVSIGQVTYLLNRKDAVVRAALTALVSVVEENPLEEVPEGRRPNSRQRREALQSVPLWLVARECLSDPSRREIGETLAARAVAGARRQVQNDHLVAILYDWGKRALADGDRQQAEQRWSDLLDLVTRRPKPKRASNNQKTSRLDPKTRSHANRLLASARGARLSVAATMPYFSLFAVVATNGAADGATNRTADGKPSQRVPPLTLSQFRIALEIALAAAENGMPQLSRRAVQASLAGGIPVPDPAAASPTAGSPFAAVRPTAAASAGPIVPGATSEIEREVAVSLQKVVRKWNGETDYPPRTVYDLLQPMVF
ncbi:MAG: hypothetical protein ACC645_23125, partial [Pirellulales bacterium]